VLKKICPKLGCNKLINFTDKYCDVHKNEQNLRYKEYDVNVRDKESTEFYNSEAWTKTRAHVLTYYNDLDVYAYYELEKIIAANTVHHIIEIKDDRSKGLTLDNLIAVSSSSHSEIHRLYNKNKIKTQKLLKELQKKFKNEFK